MGGRIQSINDLLCLLNSVKLVKPNHWMALCPAHNDRNPSLSVTALPDKILVSCQAGCHINTVLTTLKLEMSDLFLNNHKAGTTTLKEYKEIDVTYDYHDIEGNVLFQVVRFRPKSFAQRRLSREKGWIWGLRGVKPMIYHLPKVKEAITKGETIYLPEGEKDADNLISHLGVIATTCPMGAGKWRDDYAKMFVGAKEVVVISDNDPPGRRHAHDIASSLIAIDVPTKLLEMPKDDIKDISDWISAGLTMEKLQEELDGLLPYKPPLALLDGDLFESFKRTDLGNAERLVYRHGENLRYCYQRKQWLIWNGKHWQWDQGAKINSLAQKTARTIYNEAANEDNYEERKALGSHAKASESNSRIKAMIEQTEPMVAIEINDLDSHLWKLNCLNGTVDLRTGELRPHDKADYLTMMVPVDYDPNAQSDLWDAFLNRIFSSNSNLINYIQQSMGYTLTGDTQEQCLFFCWGSGSNGKSTLLNAFCEILSPFSLQADTEMFMLAYRAQKSGHSEDVANLSGKRYVVGSEIEEGRRLAVTKIKQMTGGERVRASHKHEKEFEFDVTYKIWLNGNHKPEITDTTYSIWRRVKLIPFRVKIPVDEQDKRLKYKLREVYPALLAWAVQGCLNWQQHGLQEPSEVTDAIEEYRHEQDILEDFLVDRCAFNPSSSIAKGELFKLYQDWADENGVNPVGQRIFHRRLVERGISERRGHRGKRLWSGIRLLTPEEVALETLETNETQKPIYSPYMGDLKENSDFPVTSVSNVSANKRIGTDELPDCPTCGRNEWVCLQSGEFQCSCDHSLKGGEQC